MVHLELSIDDTQWPKLKLVIQSSDVNGQKSATTQTVMYDQAYSQFENTVHNFLRPIVDSLTKRRLGR